MLPVKRCDASCTLHRCIQLRQLKCINLNHIVATIVKQLLAKLLQQEPAFNAVKPYIEPCFLAQDEDGPHWAANPTVEVLVADEHHPVPDSLVQGTQFGLPEISYRKCLMYRLCLHRHAAQPHRIP